MLASSSKDGRIKLWDLNSQSCVSTWKVGGSNSVNLIPGQALGSVVAATAGADLALVNLRTSATSGLKIIKVLRGQGSGRSEVISCSAAYGSMLAFGGRRAVQVWDIRKLPSSSSSSHAADACRANCQPVLSTRLPLDQHVAALHLDRVKLVASTRRVTLHSGGSVTVWSLPSGAMAQQLSSSPWDTSLKNCARVLCQQETAGPQAGGQGSDASDSNSESWSDGSGSGRAWAASSSSRRAAFGRLEPGVVAMAVSGPVIATVNTL
eukprot:gene1649-1991_t